MYIINQERNLITSGPVALRLFLVAFSVGMAIEIFFGKCLEVTILAIIRLVFRLEMVAASQLVCFEGCVVNEYLIARFAGFDLIDTTIDSTCWACLPTVHCTIDVPLLCKGDDLHRVRYRCDERR